MLRGVVMNRVGLALAAFLLHATPQSLLGSATVVTAISISLAPVQAQNKEAIAKIAKAITVRIEGATQGSGVIVKREGKRYKVLTAWHVVSDHLPGEELAIYTHDGKSHQLVQGSIQRLGKVDMAVLTFSNPGTYEVASIGDVKDVKYDDRIYVAGFPFNDSLNLRHESGEVVANADVGIDQGYQLLYSNRTIRGMSGGSLLNSQGKIIGIHGRGERDEKRSSGDFIVKTGINQGVPIHYFNQFVRGLPVVIVDAIAKKPDDYLAQAQASIGEPGREQTVIRLANQALKIKADSEEAYFMRAYAKDDLGDKKEAIADLNQAIAINPQNAIVYTNRGVVKSALGDKQGAIADYNRAIAIDPKNDFAYNNRANAKSDLGDKQGAITDYNRAIAINPHNAHAYNGRGNAKSALGNKQGAIADYDRAIAINPQNSEAFFNRGLFKFNLADFQGAIADYSQAITISPKYFQAYANRGVAKKNLGDKQGAIADYSQAIAINPQIDFAYNNRGNVKSDLGDYQGAIADYSQAIVINPQKASRYKNRGAARFYLGDRRGACSDYKKAESLGSQLIAEWLQSDGGAWCRSMP